MSIFDDTMNRIESMGHISEHERTRLLAKALESALDQLTVEQQRNVCADVLRLQRATWQQHERDNAASRAHYQSLAVEAARSVA